MLALALLGIVGMFASNTDWGGDPQSPRGDGKYRPVLARGDGHMTYLMARSFVLDGDLVFDNDLARFGDPWNQRRTATGRKDIPHPFGPVLVWTLPLAFAHGASKVINALGGDIASHGYTMLHQRIVFATSVLFGFGAVLLGALVARRRVGGGWPPIYAAVAILYGTTLTYYATYMPSYGHAMDAFFCAAFLGYWALHYGELRWRRFVWLGVLLGVCTLIRVQELAMGVVVAVEVCHLGARHARSRQWSAAAALLARAVLVLAIALVVFTPQLIAWKLVYGEWLTSPNGPRYVRLTHPLIPELLFASRNGWLSTHPLAYLGLVGLALVPRPARVIALGLFLALAMQVWINASVLDWWASASFGQRRMASVTVILVVGLAALLRAAAVGATAFGIPRWARHALALMILGWFVVWNLSQVSHLRHGRAAGRPAGPSCCSGLPVALRTVAQPVYDRIGNPFAMPASLLFAWRHGVDLRRWDVVVGDYVLLPAWYDYNSGKYRSFRPEWNLSSGRLEPYLVAGFGPPQRQESGSQSYRWTTASAAHALVPILLPEAHRMTIRLGTDRSVREPFPIEIALNDVVLARRDLAAGWTDVTFDVPEKVVQVGTNVLTIRADLHPHSRPAFAPPPPATAQVGVAVGSLWVGFPPIAPTDSPLP